MSWYKKSLLTLIPDLPIESITSISNHLNNTERMNRPFQLPPRTQPIFNSVREFQLIVKLGEGAFSKVYKAVHKITESIYAIKIIDFARISTLDQENIEKEIHAHKVMNHKNIVRLYDFFKEGNIVYLIMEYCVGGNLFNYLAKNNPLAMTTIQKMFKQTLDGVEYIHKKGFINRDIKPENIILDSNNNIKICDFGWATHKSDGDYRRLKAGTIPYMSPESLTGEYQDQSSDIWSLGVLLYELINNKEPYGGYSCSDQMQKIRTKPLEYIRTDVFLSAKELIKSLLVIEKDKRPKIKNIHNASFLSDYEKIQQVEPAEKLRVNVRTSVSVHAYDKPLHGPYEKDPRSVSIIGSRTNPSGNYFTNLSRVSIRSPKKNVPVTKNQLPIKPPSLKNKNLVSCRPVRRIELSPVTPIERTNRYVFRGAKVIKELNMTHSNLPSLTNEGIKRTIIAPGTPQPVRKNLHVVYSFNQNRPESPLPSPTRVSTNCVVTENDDFIIKDYGAYKKRIPKSSSVVCLQDKVNTEPREVFGMVRDIRRQLTPNVVKRYDKHEKVFKIVHEDSYTQQQDSKFMPRKVKTADYVDHLIAKGPGIDFTKL